jgi:hypothetical protein
MVARKTHVEASSMLIDALRSNGTCRMESKSPEIEGNPRKPTVDGSGPLAPRAEPLEWAWSGSFHRWLQLNEWRRRCSASKEHTGVLHCSRRERLLGV